MRGLVALIAGKPVQTEEWKLVYVPKRKKKVVWSTFHNTAVVTCDIGLPMTKRNFRRKKQQMFPSIQQLLW